MLMEPLATAVRMVGWRLSFSRTELKLNILCLRENRILCRSILRDFYTSDYAEDTNGRIIGLKCTDGFVKELTAWLVRTRVTSSFSVLQHLFRWRFQTTCYTMFYVCF